jgi:hypothetical protein
MIKVNLIVQPALTTTMKTALDSRVENVMDELLSILPKYTPKRSGSAARAWEKQGRGSQSLVINEKPYINKLESGSSSQAPTGILTPALSELKSRQRS